MSRRAITDEQRIDAYISTAPRDALVRLQSEVSAALKYRDFGIAKAEAAVERTRRKAEAHLKHDEDLGRALRAQLPLAAKVE